jgi:ADP-dependent NAD(P)H-hydrate dehydratase / NAD(P)H-hydrate epimerase
MLPVKILSSAAMREFDRRTIEDYGLPGAVLMETAGLRVVEFIQTIRLKSKKIIVLTGPGNNGGDGLVIARLLSLAGYKVSLWSTLKPGAYRNDAGTNENFLLRNKYTVQRLIDKEALQLFCQDLKEADLLVDALLGTGIDREVDGLIAEIINAVNESGLPALAVDIPSGVNADSGAIMGNAVKATWTVTFAFPKLGLMLYPGAGLAGEIFVGEINIPVQLAAEAKINLLVPSFIRSYLPERHPDAHKGVMGRTLIVAGSPGMTGAAVLAAESALKSGSGLVYLAAPESACLALESKLVEVIIIPLPESSPGIISSDAVDIIVEKASGCSALVIGPGLNTGEPTAEFLHKLMQFSPVPMVLDAGALDALGHNMNMLRSARYIPVITPHPGEMARLAGISVREVQGSRLGMAQKNAGLWNCTIVLKGANTIIASPEGWTAINPTGSVTLATAGSGDLLTGLIGSLIAQGMSSDMAAMAGVYIHGLAGDLLPSGRGYKAGDILACYGKAFRTLKDADLRLRGNPFISKIRPV